jgi:hypothetical protein
MCCAPQNLDKNINQLQNIQRLDNSQFSLASSEGISLTLMLFVWHASYLQILEMKQGPSMPLSGLHADLQRVER